MQTTPPRWPRWLLTVALPAERSEVIIGDLDEEFDARIARGAGSAEARRHYRQQALASIGAILMARVSGSPEMESERRSTGPLFGDLFGDLRGVARGWRRAPGLPITIVLTMAFGLGLASAIFAFADGYLFRPLPFPDADRLYVVRDVQSRRQLVRTSEVEALRASSVGHLGFVDASRSSPVSPGLMAIDGRDVQVFTDGIGPGFSQVVGVPLIAGRLFASADHRGEQPIPVWLTHRFWDREFAQDLSVVGRTFDVQNGPRIVKVVVVGITPAEIRTFDTNFRRSQTLPDMFAPALPEAPRQPGTGNTYTTPIVRLPAGMSREQAEAAISATLQAIVPSPPGDVRRIQLESLHAHQTAAGRPLATSFMVGALLALALVTLNLIHLLLARGAGRATELATRLALGASRWRVARLFLVESLGYAVLGIGGGLLLGKSLAAVIAAEIPNRGNDGANLALASITFDSRVVVFALAIGVVIALFGGLWPAFRAIRAPVRSTTRIHGGEGSLPARFSKTLLAAEVAASTVVLAGTVFIGLGIWRFVHQPLGFRLDDRFSVALRARVGIPEGSIDWDAVLATLQRVPGIRAASAGEDEVRGSIIASGATLTEDDGVPLAVDAAYFDARGLTLRAGRWFDESEARSNAPVAVVDEKLARRVWPDRDPIGMTVQAKGDAARTVIGVVGHQRASLVEEIPGLAYFPRPKVDGRTSFTVWVPGSSADEIVRRLSGPIAALAPNSRLTARALTFDDEFNDELSEVRIQQPVIVVLGLFAFTLSGVGLFGLVAYLVERRRRDFAIRLALGARAADIWTDVVRQSVVPALAGIAIGAGTAWALEGIVEATMFGWESSGPVALAIVCGSLLVVAVLAAAGPARRVLRIDPTVALRAE